MTGVSRPLQTDCKKRIATVRVKDVAAPAYCRHVSLNSREDLRAQAWNMLRGLPLQIDLDSFHSGLCALCDCWLLAGEQPQRDLCAFWNSAGFPGTATLSVLRAELELGD